MRQHIYIQIRQRIHPDNRHKNTAPIAKTDRICAKAIGSVIVPSYNSMHNDNQSNTLVILDELYIIRGIEYWQKFG